MNTAPRSIAVLLACAAFIVFLGGPTTTRADEYPTVHYVLAEGSTYQVGCFEPCMCPLIEEQPMIGTFDLVYYPFAGPVWTVAVENVAWNVPSLGRQITGQGIYRKAGAQHELYLDLQIDGGTTTAFDSGWVEGGDSFPLIDATVSIHGMFCYDTVLRIHAVPIDDGPRLTFAGAQLSWTAIPGASQYDVVSGDLTGLRASGGDFASSVDACLAEGYAGTMLQQSVVVASGRVVWFLVRTDGGSYDSIGDTRATSRDPGIAASPLACP